MVYITCLTDKFGHPEFVKEGKETVESSRVLGSLSPITIELACDDPDYYNQLHERTKKAILAIDGNEDLSFASKSWVSKLMGK